MKKSTNKHDIYFVIQPLHLVSKILGLPPLHIDPKYKCQNERTWFYIHVSLSIFMIVLVLYVFCESIIYITASNVNKLNSFTIVVWIIAVTASLSMSILALLLNFTRNRNHIGNVLSTISRVDSTDDY
jgi:hypothetical protein